MRSTTGRLASACGGVLSGPGELAVSGVSTDTRTLQPGELFVALRGEHHDGHRFVEAAWQAGAAAVLVQRPFEPPPGRAVIVVRDTLLALGDLARARRAAFDGLVVGITGSVGKSSTKELVGEVLSQAMPTLRSRSSYNNEIGLPLTVLALAPEHRALVLELAMRGPGQIAYLTQIARPQIGVLTTLGVSHVGLLGSPEAVATAKGELLEELGPDGTAVLNADDVHQARQALRHSGRILWYGWSAAADVRAESLELGGLAGSRFRLVTPRGRIEVSLSLPGRHNVANALAAAGVGVAAGLSLEQVGAGLEACRVLPLRMEVRRLAGGVTLINDAYNAAPDSVAAALQVAAGEPCAGRRIAVLGDMLELGNVAEVEHLRAGHAAAAAMDVVIAVGELGSHLAAGARDEGGAAVYEVATPAEAAALLRELLRPGDLVLLKASRAVGLDAVAGLLEEPG